MLSKISSARHEILNGPAVVMKQSHDIVLDVPRYFSYTNLAVLVYNVYLLVHNAYGCVGNGPVAQVL